MHEELSLKDNNSMYLKRLSDKIWLTRNARFNAARRMKRNHISSTASVALLSASVIAVNLMAFIDGTCESDKTLITIASIILSTFAMVMSLLIALLRYESREENYHQCGMELESLNQKICIRIEELTPNGANPDNIVSSKEDNLKYQGDYVGILRKYNLNHTMFDYEYGSLSDTSKSPSPRIIWWLRLRMYIFDVYVLYWIIAVFPMVAIFILFAMCI